MGQAMCRHSALLPNIPSSVRITRTIFVPMAFPLTLFIFSFDDLQTRFHLGALSMLMISTLDLSMSVQIHRRFVSFFEQPFIHQVERFEPWKTHSMR
ncbi:MAG: hypothetical protein VX071_04130, partial [Candidatus Thermoplasmatota archaeon]|nr:hypothetical protein [Candidatus Thermoplasmatota archaeon]